MVRMRRSTGPPQKTKVIRGSKPLERSQNRKGARDAKVVPAAAGHPLADDPTRCLRCGAVYTRKMWHPAGSVVVRKPAKAVCPGCLQVSSNEYFGRVILRNPGEDEGEIRRRIDNVARRAEHTQPERRVVAIERRGADLDVFTTSQKLAHRIAREVEKAFGGRVHYDWSDGDGSLLAVWSATTAAPGLPPAARRRGAGLA